MSKRSLILGVVVIAGAAAWYAFRPERLFINKTVSEALPAAAGASAAATLARGEFHSNAHETRGQAAVVRLADGSRVLRLSDFETSNGPDVRVFLVAAPDVQDDGTVKQAGYVELGPLKGNIGDQNYTIPASVDLGSYRTVTIWCNRFSVNFGSAPLRPAGPETLTQGSFHSNAHETRGQAAIIRLPDGRRVLRLTDFETSNGPDVRVYLVAAADVTDDATVTRAGFVELGALKGNIGDQNYDVPADLDLGKYRAVTIWCHRFNVNFGSAPLN